MKYILSLLFVALVCWLTYSCSDHKKKVSKEIIKVSENIAALDKAEAFDDTSIAMAEATYPSAKKAKGEIKDTSAPVTMLSMAEPKNRILELSPKNFKFSFPIGGKITSLLLDRVDVVPTNILTEKDSVGKTTISQRFLTYRGKVEGLSFDSSIVSLTVSLASISGMVITPAGKFTIGTIAGDISGDGVVYNDTTSRPFNCGVDDDFVKKLPEELKNKLSQTKYSSSMTADAAVTKCVNWYWEIDYDIFANKGSLAATTQYIMEVWGLVSTLYANDGININLKTLFVWTSQDPYTGPSTSAYLNQFGDRMEATNFNSSLGDLANLIGFQGNGGIAWIGTPCSAPRYETAYCGISSYYNSLPSYSWTIEVIAHEQGHNLGSRHTHDCVWGNGNEQIDGCGNAAGYGSGSCAVIALSVTYASGGGTIMSYCHLTYVGINFLLGFGPQPVAQMIWVINTASCFQTCGGPPPPPNEPPVANAGPDLTITTSSTQLTGSGTDDVAVTQAYWGYVSGTPPLPNLSGNGNTATASNLHTGVYQFAFKVIDAQGLSNSDTMQLTVNLGGPPPGVVFTDNFNRTDLDNNWTSVKGGWQLSNNELNNNSATVAQENILIQQTFYDTVQSDFAGVDMNTGPRFGLIMCYQGVGNYYLLYRNTGGTSQFRISKFVNGVETVLKTKNVGNPAKCLLPATNCFFKLRGRKVGNTIFLDFNGVNQILIADNTFSNGATGVYIQTKTFKHRIDNFSAQ